MNLRSMHIIIALCGIAVSTLASICIAQSATSGNCSPVAPSNQGNITITCTGIDPSQTKQIAYILNRIAKKRIDPTVVLEKLDEIESGVKLACAAALPRQVPDNSLSSLGAFLGQKVFFALGSTAPEVENLGTSLSTALRRVGWRVNWPPPSWAMLYIPGGSSPQPEGIEIYSGPQSKDAALALINLLNKAGLNAVAGSANSSLFDHNVGNDEVGILIFVK